jgi:hypothetical protein
MLKQRSSINVSKRSFAALRMTVHFGGLGVKKYYSNIPD